MALTTRLLEYLTFARLNSLELKVTDKKAYPNINERRQRTQALIKTIHNVPSLEKLILSQAVVKVSDVERIHANATKLKHLGFDHVDIDAACAACGVTGSGVIYQPVDSHQVLSLCDIRLAEEVQRLLDNAIQNWIIYWTQVPSVT